MSGKHVKLRAWRRGGGTPVKSVVLGGAAWVSISAVLAVAVPGDPPVGTGADPAPPSPSALPEDPTRDPVVTRSAEGARESRVLASPSADVTQRPAGRSLVGELLGAGGDAASTALSATADATSSALAGSPTTDPAAGSDPSGPRPSETRDPAPSGDAEPSEDPEPSEGDESEEGDEPEEDQPSDDPGPPLDLPTVPTVPPVGLP